MLHRKWQDCEVISSVLGPRKEHGSSLTLLCLHLILPNSYKTSSSKEEADLLHQNNSARKRTNVLCILPWKYELNIDALTPPEFHSLPFSSNLPPLSVSIHHHVLLQLTHRWPQVISQPHVSTWNYLTLSRLSNLRACTVSTSILTETMCGPFFPQKPLYWMDSYAIGRTDIILCPYFTKKGSKTQCVEVAPSRPHI